MLSLFLLAYALVVNSEKAVIRNMKAVVVRQLGDADSALTYETDYPFDDKDLADGQIIVQNAFAGLNFIDTYYRTGLYKQPAPFVAGQEGGGTVLQSKHPDFVVGDRVVYMAMGSYCEYVKIPANKCAKVPDNMDIQVAIAAMVQGLTAHYLVTDATVGLIQKSQWCLIYSVGSGTTQWAAQMAKLQGYKVIGTTSRGKADRIPKDSIDELIVLDPAPCKNYADYTSVNIVDRVMDITKNKGCHCIIDGVGKSTADISVSCLALRGIWITFGNASGPVPDFALLRLAAKSAFVTRPKLNDYISTKQEFEKRVSDVFYWIQNGKLSIKIDRVFDLQNAADGHKYLESGQSNGKILFKI